MIFARSDPLDDVDTLPRMPPWIPSAQAETFEDAAFFSGAALAHLQDVSQCGAVPHPLLRDRLALRAAEACMVASGRPERALELRDTLHLMRPGDLPGPAGDVYLHWRRAVERPVSVAALHRALPQMDPGRIAERLDAGEGSAVARAAQVLEAGLTEAPHAEVAALILAEAALAQALGWRHPVPLLAAGLRRGDLGRMGADLRLACHRAAAVSAVRAARLAADLARGAARLKAVAPTLRAKRAREAVEIFLTRDAVAPAALPLPDRAARRLCDRLVGLGAVRELTGRDTFRLYGV